MEEKQKKDGLSGIVDVTWLTKDNATFCDDEGFLSMDMGEDHYDRVLLSRCFPFDEPETHISVTDCEMKEIGLIRDLQELSEESREACRTELSRKYFTREILSIEKIKERYGFTHWDVTTASGKKSFSVQDTYRSITKITPDHLLVYDVDGNVYEIMSVDALPRKSYRHLELYL